MRLPSKVVAGVGASALSIAGVIVGHFEGTENTAYKDPVGIPTVCTGHTGPNVEIGKTLSDEECQDLLQGDLQESFSTLKAYIDPDVFEDMPKTRRAALASFVFNVGAGNFRHSTLLILLNNGHPRAACNELTRWTHAGGRVLPGLVKRRRAEKKLCLMGLPGEGDQ